MEGLASFDVNSLWNADTCRQHVIGMESTKSKIEQFYYNQVFKKARATMLGVREKKKARAHDVYWKSRTGKTMVASVMAGALQMLGLSNEKFRVISQPRSELVSKYSSGSGKQTEQLLREHAGGVVFIDEAYQLIMQDDDYGKEAMQAIMDVMNGEKPAKDIPPWKPPSIILAGYPAEMGNSLASIRFPAPNQRLY